jgi:hypothetical protein
MSRHRNLGGLVLGFLFAASPALSGIAFEAMPVGCSWTVSYSDGQTNTETYLGVKSGRHKTKVVDASNPEKLVRYGYFDKKGRLVRKDWAHGKWEKFAPYSCFDIEGGCSYVYSNADGVRQEIASKTTTSGKGFRVTAGPVGGAPYPDEYFELGQFGLMTKNKSANYSARLVKVENCGLGS